VPIVSPVEDGPLPSFPIDDEPSFVEPTAATDPPVFDEPAYGPDAIVYESDAPRYAPPEDAYAAQPQAEATSSGQLDEAALEEVEFFLSQGMLDEARNIVTSELARLPNHPLLLERLAEIDSHGEAAIAPPPASSVQGHVVIREAPGRVPSQIDLDRSFDIAASLEALDALDASEDVEVGDDPRQVSVESVFEQFKAGVAAQISESDASTHYDLGVAYKEMGLTNDAIGEFELASRDPGRECVCQSMIGMLYLQSGDVDKAIDAFIRGLHASQRTTDQELALTYEIGNAYEMRNNPEQALYYFQRVARIDPDYRDPRGAVEARITRLEPAQKPAPARAAVGAEHVADEFDAAFDDLLSGSKLP
jgi:tetratricopeptide (TPR) repeat protein